MRIRTRRLLLTITAVALVGSVGPIPPVDAQQEAQCTVTIPDVVVEPGLSTEPNSGVYHTHTENGTIDCGDAGKGTIGLDGRYGTEDADSCQSGGEGWGVFSVTLDGKPFKDTFTVKFGANTDGTDAGEIQGERISGKYTFTGTEGNCVTSPITKGDVKMVAATLKG